VDVNVPPTTGCLNATKKFPEQVHDSMTGATPERKMVPPIGLGARQAMESGEVSETIQARSAYPTISISVRQH